MTKTRTAIQLARWGSYFGVLLALFIIQVTPGWFAIMGIKPMLLVPFVVCLSMFETEKTSAVFALIAGGFWDASSQKMFGFSSLILLICCVACTLLVMYLIKPNLVNSILLCFGALFVYYFVDFIFYFFIWGYSGVWWYLLYHILPTIVYTVAVSPLLFFLMRALCGKFREML